MKNTTPFVRIRSRRLAVLLAICSVFPAATKSTPIFHARSIRNVDYVVAGVGGVGGGSGTITVTGVNGPVTQAFLYWHGIADNAGLVYDNPTVTINGNPVTGISLGDAPENCWTGFQSSRAFEADVTAFVSGNGLYTVAGLSDCAGCNANGASLIVIFDDGNPGNNRDLAFFTGNDSNAPEGFPGEDDGWHATLGNIDYAGGLVKAVFHVADGQAFEENSLTFSTQTGSLTIADNSMLWDGNSVADAGTSRASNGSLWDIHTLEISSAFGPPGHKVLHIDGMASFVSSDCIGLVALLLDFDAGTLPLPPPPTPTPTPTPCAIVTTTADSGPGSLRAAILSCGNPPGTGGTIGFNIPGSGVHTIQPSTPLPAITVPVTIDGYTQPGATPNSSPVGDNAVLLVELSGPAGGGSASGLRLSSGSDGSTIRGLVINGFPNAAVLISGSANHTVEGCFIGTDAAGLAAHPNPFGIDFFNGSAGGSHVGGPAPAQRNVISGNTSAGIHAFNADGQTIQGNYIGVNRNGTMRITAPTSAVGLSLSGSSPVGTLIGGTAPGAGNVICTFGDGISVGTPNNVIEGNFIGVDATGGAVLGNHIGINVNQGNQRIGGPTAASRNVISGNSVHGISINGGDNCVIQSNYIGTDVTGMIALGNGTPGFGYAGILFANGAQNTTIGGLTDIPGTPPGNLVSGNTDYGIRSTGTTSSAGTIIQGNAIGVKADDISPLGNTRSGISLGERGVTVGGVDPRAANVICASIGSAAGSNGDAGIAISSNFEVVMGNYIGTNVNGTTQLGNAGYGILVNGNNNQIAANVIASNGRNGVMIPSFTSNINNHLAGNSIYGNASLGIDLAGNGVTLNDSCDGDSGPNRLQNFPVITSAISSAGTTTISGSLNSNANTIFRIEFFANAGCDMSNFGEGERFLGAAEVTTDVTCNAIIDATLPVSLTSDEAVVTATATDPSGNTSEFSSCIAGVPGPIRYADPDPDPDSDSDSDSDSNSNSNSNSDSDSDSDSNGHSNTHSGAKADHGHDKDKPGWAVLHSGWRDIQFGARL